MDTRNVRVESLVSYKQIRVLISDRYWKTLLRFDIGALSQCIGSRLVILLVTRGSALRLRMIGLYSSSHVS
jgi:hypothetical protein